MIGGPPLPLYICVVYGVSIIGNGKKVNGS